MHKISLLHLKAFIFTFLFVFLIAGCAGPGHYINDSDISLSDTRRSLVKLFGEPRQLSQNGREFVTFFMDKKGRVLEGLKKAKERRFAHVTILGERRPYDILVNVVVESQVTETAYEASDTDDELSEALAKAIKSELLKSLENRNMIDDFNAF